MRVLVIAACAALVIAPSLADARAGSGSSFGSRGSRTYQYNNAQPMQRSITPEPAPQYSPRPTQPLAPAYGGGYGYGGHPFLSGLAGGFIGAGLAGMLFGHGFYGGGGYGMGGAGFLGLLLQLLLVGGLVYWGVRAFRRNAGPAGLMSGFGGFGVPAPMSNVSRGVTALPVSTGTPIEIQDADFEQFSALLAGIQDAWSHGDITRLRQMTTPEMLSYFGEQLAGNVSRGIENKVEDVVLLHGELSEAWEEYGTQYATTRMRFAARDYMTKLGSRPGEAGAIVAGDPGRPVEAEEMWTFTRVRGGRWLLSAIQQV